MRIGINANALFIKNKTGVSRYLTGMLKYLVLDDRFEFHLYAPNIELSLEGLDWLSGRANVVIHKAESRLGRSVNLWFAFLLPLYLSRDKIDWLFSPDYFLPPLMPRRLKRSIFLHDISYVAHPSWVGIKAKLIYAFFSVLPARRANLVFTVSDYSKAEIVRLLSIPDERIVVAPGAIDRSFYGNAAAGARTLEDIGDRYFLYVGEIFTRRCVPQMIEGFRIWAEGAGDTRTRLLIRGKNMTIPYVDIESLVRKSNEILKREAVLLLPRLEDEELVRLYANSIANVYISTYEGFGLPVLESMALGQNVITVKKTSIPEIGKDSVIYVRSTGSRHIALAFEEAMKQEREAQGEARARRIALARKFDWETTARIIAEALE